MTGRIAVTGVGIVSALGGTAPDTFARLLAGERGFGPITLFDTTDQRTLFGAEVRGFRVEDVAPRGAAARFSRSDALALAAAREALAFAGASAERVPQALVVGVTTGGMLETEAALGARDPEVLARSGERLVSYPPSSPAHRLAEVLGPFQRTATVCSACSSGANAVVQAAAWILSGKVERALAGGTDALCRLTFTGFNALGATDAVPCRPFDAQRAGLTLGEGAGFLLLESEELAVSRGARVLAWLSGWGAGAEAHHITQPEPTGKVPTALIRKAFTRAGLSPSDVDYVNAHGTGTVPNDAVETLAIRAAFGTHAERVLVSSSKGQIGHTLGAAGAIEAAITVLSLEAQHAPPTGGLVLVADDCRLAHVMGTGRRTPLRAAISSSFGFGGTGSTLLFERADRERRGESPRRTSVLITGIACLGQTGFEIGEAAAKPLESEDRPVPFAGDAHALLDATRSRRFDRVACLVTAGAEAALRSANRAPDGVGLVASTAFGNVSRTASFIHTSMTRGPRRAPPAEFPHLVPSAASGNASVYLGLSGPVLTTCDLDLGGEAAVAVACDWTESGVVDAFLAGAAEVEDAFVTGALAPACETARAPRVEGSAWVLLESEESALRRGARAFARVHAVIPIRIAEIEAARLTPPTGAASLVLAVADGAPFGSLLARFGWERAARRSLASAIGWHEGLGAHAVAAGAALLGRGRLDDVLILGASAATAYGIHLVRTG